MRRHRSDLTSIVVTAALVTQSMLGLAVPTPAAAVTGESAVQARASDATLDRNLSPVDVQDGTAPSSVMLDPNGGRGGSRPVEVAADGTVSVPECPFTNGTRRFIGWSTSPAGEGDLFMPGQSMSLAGSESRETTLYATWSGEGESIRSVLGIDDDATVREGGLVESLESRSARRTADNEAPPAPYVSEDSPSIMGDDPLSEPSAGDVAIVGTDLSPATTPGGYSVQEVIPLADAEAMLAARRAPVPSPDSAGGDEQQSAPSDDMATDASPDGRRAIPRTGGAYYVSSTTMSRVVDGTAPFDANNNQGNDRSDSNNIVRSFDTILYNVGYVTALTDPQVPVSEGQVRASFGLGKSPKSASFDIDALSWMRDKVVTFIYEDGYIEQYSDTDTGANWKGTLDQRDWHYPEERGIEWTHGDVTRQTVEGYRYLSSFSNAIPGTGTLSFAIQVSGAMNGETIKPDVSVWTDDTPRKTVSNVPTTTVTAAPNYDLQILYESETTGRSWMWLDKENGVTYAVKQPGVAEEKARLFGYSVTFALKNADASKGMKGVALPRDQVMFDVRTESSFLATGASEEYRQDKTQEPGWIPYLWDVHESGRDYATPNTPYGNGIWTESGGTLTLASRRQMRDFASLSASQPTRTAPYNEHTDEPWNETQKRYEASCYHGGNIFALATSQPNVFKIVMDGFEIDYKTLQFPSRVMATWYSNYLAHSGTLASGHFMVAMPVPESITSGSEHLSVTLENLYTKMGNEDFLYYRTEPNTDNNHSGHNNNIYGPGTYTQYIYYVDNPNWDKGDYQSYAFRKNRLRIHNTTTAETAFKGSDLFLKFDDEFVELLPNDSLNNQYVGVTDPSITPAEFTRFYAAKPDGTGWVDDDEMQAATQESLWFFESLEDLEEAGKTCVGVLLEVRSPTNEIWKSPSGVLSLMDVVAKTKPEAENSAVYKITGDSRAWSEAVTANLVSVRDHDHVLPSGIHYYGYCDSSWTHPQFQTTDPTTGKITETYQYKPGYPIPTYVFNAEQYHKTTYEDGKITGGHTPGIFWGDSALVIGDQADISIHTVVNDGSDKIYYDLDNGERTAMVKVTTGANFVSANQALASEGMVDNLTVTVVLPPTLTYMEGSASIPPVSVTTDADGNTVLVFVLTDVTVGGEETDITFLTKIGHIGQPDDVDNNESITVEAAVISDKNPAAPSVEESTIADASIRVIKLAATAVAKDSVIDISDLGEENGWILHFGNSSEIEVKNGSIMDVLPYDGDPNGSEFHGGYRVTGMSVDLTDAPAVSAAQTRAWVTTAEAVRGTDAGTVTNLGAGIWSATTPSVNGRNVSFALPSGVDASKITAVRFTFGDIAGREYIHARINYSPKDGSGQMISAGGAIQQGLDKYCNVFSQWSDNQAAVVSSNLVTEQVVARVVRGKVWHDEDHNGFQDEGEEYFAGVPVSLVDADGTTMTSLTTGEPLTTVTDADGCYEFVAVPSGTGYVRFENSSHMLDLYATTMRYALLDGESCPSIDSDVSGENGSDGKLQTMTSGSIWLPLAKQIVEATYLVENIDAGLTLKKATWQPAALKTMENRDLMNEFQFEVEDVSTGQVVSSGTSDANNGRVYFDPIEYDATESGEHRYVIREIYDGQPGVTYDLSDKEVIVFVEDTGEANMAVYDSSASLPYEFETQGEDTEVSALAGGNGVSLFVYNSQTDGLAVKDDLPLEAGKSYTVSYKMRKTGGKLTGIGGYDALTPVTAFVVDGKAYGSYSAGAPLPNDKDIHVVQTSFRYDGGESDELGMYDRFWIQPNRNSDEAVAVSIWDFKIVEDPVIQNVYHSEGEYLPQAKKVLTGRDLAAGQFTFELFYLDADENEHIIETATNDEFGNVHFSKMHFDEHDVPARLDYYIREVNDGRPGYTYETNTRTVRLALTDNWDGTIDVSVSNNGGTNLLRGHDFLAGDPSASGWLEAGRKTDHWIATKTATNDPTLTIPGSMLTDLRSYLVSYKVRSFSDDPSASGGSVGRLGIDAGSSQVLRAEVDDASVGDLSSLAGGVTPTGAEEWHVVQAVVRAVDADGDGTIDDVVLHPAVGATEGDYEVYDITLNDIDSLSRFTNAYHAHGGWVPAATKSLTGRDLADGQFRFEMARTDTADLTAQLSQLGGASATYDAATGTMSVSGGNGTTDVRFPNPAGKVIYGGSGTWSFDVFVPSGAGDATIRLDENNRLDGAEATPPADEDLHSSAPYDRQRTGLIDGAVASRDATDPAIMSATLPRGQWVNVRQTYMNDSLSNTRQKAIYEAGTTLGITGGEFQIRNLRFSVGSTFATNQANGTIEFARIAYDETDAGKTYTYSIIEQDARRDGYTYDKHHGSVSVEVVDNGDGTLTVTPTYGTAATGDAVAFSNAYAATGTARLTAWKALRGRPLVANEFTFSLYDANDLPIDDSDEPVATGTNDADGVISFSGIEFDQTDVGHSYYYVAKEDVGSDEDVVYTNEEFRYKVTVTDDGNGTLSFDIRNVDETGADTTTVPFFINNLKAGKVAIEKRTNGGEGNETFTYHLRIRNEDGTPFAPVTLDVTVEPLEDGTGGSGGGTSGGSGG